LSIVNHLFNSGFTFVEVLIAAMLIGLAVASLLAANGVFTKATGAGTNLSTAEFLIEQIKERTALVDYDDLYDFNGANFSPPIGVDGQVLNDFAAFSQHITVENVSASDFEQLGDPNSGFVRVTVKVLLNSREISSASWFRARY